MNLNLFLSLNLVGNQTKLLKPITAFWQKRDLKIVAVDDKSYTWNNMNLNLFLSLNLVGNQIKLLKSITTFWQKRDLKTINDKSYT